MTTLKLICFLGLFTGVFSEIILESPIVSNFGEWGTWDRCPNERYAVGFQLRTEAWLGPLGDDTALNAIRFLCEEPGNEASSISYTISSSVGQFGDWGSIFGCYGLATGFQLKSENPTNVDNTAANNLRLFCSGMENFLEGDGERWGDWTESQKCVSKQALCAIQVQLEPFQGITDDDTSLNNFRAECCDVSNPGSICTPTDDFLFILSCDNREGTTNLTCVYNYDVGLTIFPGSESDAYGSIGFTLEDAGEALQLNFEDNLGTSNVTGNDWAAVGEKTWEPQISSYETIIVPPEYLVEVYQIRGNCGFYNVASDEFDIREFEAGSDV